MNSEKALEPCPLSECPPGLFWFGETLGFKTEYGAAEWLPDTQTFTIGRYSDVYVVESGEAFWGGVSNRDERENLIVTPVEALAKPSPAPVEREGVFSEWSTASLAGQCRMQAREQLDPEFSQFMEAVAARLAALAPEPVREGQRVGNDELTDAKQLLDMLVAADDEAKPNGIMDCIDNDGSPYQSAFMAGLITHARMLVRPYDHAAAIAAFRASEPLSAREGE